jgi:hypothetical protein
MPFGQNLHESRRKLNGFMTNAESGFPPMEKSRQL